ncbi:MAG: hypothetical protein ACLR23_12445 [Clostridia bacterium]
MQDQLITLGIGLGLGATLIVVAIVMNIINQVKRKEYGKALFDKNGVAGLVFYLSVILFAFGVYAGQVVLSSAGFLVVFVILPLLIIFFGEPLERWMKTKSSRAVRGTMWRRCLKSSKPSYPFSAIRYPSSVSALSR